MANKFVLKMSHFAMISVGLTFLSEAALADKMYGLFMVVKGSVQVQSGAGAAADVKVGSKIFEGDTVISGPDSRAKIVMSDRNTININPETKMKIETYVNDTASGQKAVSLNLIEGKVRNNVEQTYDGTKSTFQIKTPTAVAGVRGTQFLATYNKVTQVTGVVTFKGAVTLASVNSAGKVVGNPVVITKGKSSETAPNKPAAAPAPVPKDTMKKMDGESSVSLKSTTTGGSPTASSGGPSGSSGSSSASSGGGGSTTSSSNSGSQPGPASVGGPGPSTASASTSGSMIDSKDMDVGMAKGISAASAAAPPPPPMALLLTPTAPPPISTLVQGVINNTAGKTTLVVTPSPR
jgi:uncharacterized membrane protein YgcG